MSKIKDFYEDKLKDDTRGDAQSAKAQEEYEACKILDEAGAYDEDNTMPDDYFLSLID